MGSETHPKHYEFQIFISSHTFGHTYLLLWSIVQLRVHHSSQPLESRMVLYSWYLPWPFAVVTLPWIRQCTAKPHRSACGCLLLMRALRGRSAWRVSVPGASLESPGSGRSCITTQGTWDYNSGQQSTQDEVCSCKTFGASLQY